MADHHHNNHNNISVIVIVVIVVDGRVVVVVMDIPLSATINFSLNGRWGGGMGGVMGEWKSSIFLTIVTIS